MRLSRALGVVALAAGVGAAACHSAPGPVAPVSAPTMENSALRGAVEAGDPTTEGAPLEPRREKPRTRGKSSSDGDDADASSSPNANDESDAADDDSNNDGAVDDMAAETEDVALEELARASNGPVWCPPAAHFQCGDANPTCIEPVGETQRERECSLVHVVTWLPDPDIDTDPCSLRAMADYVDEAVTHSRVAMRAHPIETASFSALGVDYVDALARQAASGRALADAIIARDRARLPQAKADLLRKTLDEEELQERYWEACTF